MPAKYILHFPKPVFDDFVRDIWLPVVGAGISLNPILPASKKMPPWAAWVRDSRHFLRRDAATARSRARWFEHPLPRQVLAAAWAHRKERRERVHG